MNDREMEARLLREISFAVPPWKSLDAMPQAKIAKRSDSQEQINKCLSCPKMACTNCLCGRKSKYKYVRKSKRITVTVYAES